jgi:acetyl esterase/lipase
MTTDCRESSTLYQATDGGELPLLVFEPGDGTPPRAGIVMFHGGALRKGSPDSLAPHCRALASRGILAGSAGYRLLGHGAATIDDCIADVRRAIEQFGRLAAQRGLGASHLASGGSSAGAHLALVAAMIASNEAAPAPKPCVAAVVALNPAGLDLGSLAPQAQRQLEHHASIREGRLTDYSMIEFVQPGNPPILIHHGTRDAVEPIESVRRFRDAMEHSGNECTLHEYERAEHGFHYPVNSTHFDGIIADTARFLLDRFTAK